MTFDHVGLTPGDTYWAYVDRSTHLMNRWGFILEDEAGPKATESLWDWTDRRPVGPVTLAARRVHRDDPERSIIEFKDLEAADAWPDSVFTSPAPLRP